MTNGWLALLGGKRREGERLVEERISSTAYKIMQRTKQMKAV